MFKLISTIDSYVLRTFGRDQKVGFIYIVMSFFTLIGRAAFIWIGLSIFLSLREESYTPLWTMIISQSLLFMFVDFVIKRSVKRLRPTPDEQSFVIESGYSFPSGHSASSVFGSLLLGNLGWWVYLLAFVVIYSRLYLKKHYMSDVIAGGFLGFITWMVTLL